MMLATIHYPVADLGCWVGGGGGGGGGGGNPPLPALEID